MTLNETLSDTRITLDDNKINMGITRETAADNIRNVGNTKERVGDNKRNMGNREKFTLTKSNNGLTWNYG